MMVRVSSGSAVRLGLKRMRIDCLPTTIYLMPFGVCKANCLFCSQLVSPDHLSRVQWPAYPLQDVVSRITDERVCIQCLNYDTVFSDVLELVESIRSRSNKKLNPPISVSAQPFSKQEIVLLKHKIDRISINLDCATPQLFQKIKPYYTWKDHVTKLLYAREIFGPFKASSHLIVGLGECEEDMITLMKFLYTHEISCSLFAFTPIKGTPLEKKKKPALNYYRRMQAAHYLIYHGGQHFEFEKGKIINFNPSVPAEAFMTRGCPGCNRPYYTETPSNVYNFPYVPNNKEMEMIKKQLAQNK